MNPSVASSRARVESVDVVRGVIMIIMALDHTRDFFGIPGQNPTNLANTTAALFFTRWVTHFCAPVFSLLTGTGAYLSLRRKIYPLCRWFAALKQRRSNAWLSYL